MPLYIDEIWVKDPTPARMKQFVEMIGQAAKNPASIGAPQEVKIVAGPWGSNEEPKIIFVIDIPNHTTTYQVFSKFITQGLIERRRLTPVVDWSEVEKAATQW